MQDFERERYSVRGRGITVTSYYDDVHKRWYASAPNYLTVLHNHSDEPITGETRQKAVSGVLSQIEAYLMALGVEEKINTLTYLQEPKPEPRKR